MITSHSHKFIFIHVYKVAGSSMESVLNKYEPRYVYFIKKIYRKLGWNISDHITAMELRNKINVNIFNNYFKFAFVRNPFDWQVSLFCFARKNKKHHQHEMINKMTFDFYIDYIITDGGSVDGSLDIIKKYDFLLKENKYPIGCRGIEFRWWSKPDKGQTNALNNGFRVGTGDICAWINSDDWYEPGVFQIIINKFRENPIIDLIYGNTFDVFGDKKRRGEASQSDFEKNLQEGCQISQQAAFFTRKSLERAGFLNESFSYCMDYDLWMKILKNGKVLFVNADLANFRLWPESKTCSMQKKFKEEENIIRKKYGGSIINPGVIHRLRYRIPGIDIVKKHCPRGYRFCKNIIYRVINLWRYK